MRRCTCQKDGKIKALPDKEGAQGDATHLGGREGASGGTPDKSCGQCTGGCVGRESRREM